MNKKSNIPEANEIWAILKEASQNIKSISAETREQIKASSAETDKKIKETWAQIRASSAKSEQEIKVNAAKSEREIKAMRKDFNKIRDIFTSQWGRLIESLVEGDLVKLLREREIEVFSTQTSTKGTYKGDHWELDIVAVNSKEVVLVEVKSNLKVKDVRDFEKTLGFFTSWRPEYKGKKVYGAVAYLRADEKSPRYAEKQGLFVIRATGSSSSIINKESFKPKAYS